MKQEDRELLLADLCARLPYGVMLNTPIDNKALLALVFSKKYNTIIEYNDYHGNENDISEWEGGDIEFVKPYLRPMLSMTEEERIESLEFAWEDDYGRLASYNENIPKYIDWLNAHHFDHRNLIERGLAIAVTEENDPYKE